MPDHTPDNTSSVFSILMRSILAVFFAAVVLGVTAFFLFFRSNTLGDIKTEAETLLSAIVEMRNYTVTNVTPLLRRDMEIEFHPESVPSFVAKSVFRRLSAELPNYSYREAALNPTNREDLANPFEADLILQFRQDEGRAELTGIRGEGLEQLYYVARPIIVTDPRCLMCHSTPEAAPQSMIELYGSENGFGWQMNEVVGVQVLTIPVTDKLRSVFEVVAIFLLVLVLLFVVLCVIVLLPLKRRVVQPLRDLSKAAERASLRESPTPLPDSNISEIGTLARSIDRLRVSLSIAMKDKQGS